MNLKAIAGTLAFASLSSTAVADCFNTEWTATYVNGETSSEYSIPEYTPPPEFESTPPPELLFETSGSTPGGFESSSDVDYDGFAVSGEIFLAPVSCDNGPLKEAAFLSQASSIGAGYAQLETDDGIDTDAWNLFARIVANSWVFEGEFTQFEEDAEFVDTEIDAIRVAVGRYLADSTQLLFAYETTEFEDLADVDRFSVDIKHIASLENGQSFTAQALVGYVQTDSDFGGDDDGFDVQLLGDWYFNDQFSIGTELDFADRDSSGSLFSWMVNATYFFSERISLELAYQEVDDDALSVFGDQFTVEFKYRR